MLKFLRLLFLITTSGIFAQSPEIDLPSYGSGPFLTTDQSHWSLFRNMAGLANTETWQLILGYHLPYNLPELQSLALGLIIPGPFAMGISLYQSGTEYLIHQQVAFNTSVVLDRFSVGLRVKYWRVGISGVHASHSYSVAAGIQLELSEELLAGVFMGNLTQNQLGKHARLPVTWHSGLKYTPNPKLNILTEMGHFLGSHWELKFGVEYTLKEKFSTRTGYNVFNKQSYFGIGFKHNSIIFDYALDFNTYLGVSHQAGLSYCRP